MHSMAVYVLPTRGSARAVSKMGCTFTNSSPTWRAWHAFMKCAKARSLLFQRQPYLAEGRVLRAKAMTYDSGRQKSDPAQRSVYSFTAPVPGSLYTMTR